MLDRADAPAHPQDLPATSLRVHIDIVRPVANAYKWRDPALQVLFVEYRRGAASSADVERGFQSRDR
jgi:hypothetical protein